MFAERVNVSDFESAHFQTQLVERLGWAVGDAAAVEERPASDHADHEQQADYPDQEYPDAPARVVVLSGRTD
jgi:hypothetical protein